MNTLANLRDVAERLPVGAMREGFLLRSEAPLEGDAAPSIAVWPPRTVIDLRHPLEREPVHPLAGSSTAVYPATLLDPTEPGPEGPGSREDLGSFYHSLLEAPAAGRLAGIVEIVATAPEPILIHCIAGKDRTGVAVALVLRLVGIDREHVVAEYLITNDRTGKLLERLRLHYSRIDRNRDSIRNVTGSDIKAPRELIERIVDHWDAHPGGTVGWYLDNGGTTEIVERLTVRLTSAVS